MKWNVVRRWVISSCFCLGRVERKLEKDWEDEDGDEDKVDRLNGGGGREDGDEAGWFDGWPGGRGDVREASLELRDSMNDSGVEMGRAIFVEDVILMSQSEMNGEIEWEKGRKMGMFSSCCC
jgi:hypothetical protein